MERALICEKSQRANGLLALLILLFACTDARTVVIVSDGGESQAAYDCRAPDRSDLGEENHQAILDYIARMTGAGAVPAESLPALMSAYERREWGYLEQKVVDHACREGVLAGLERGFPAPGTEAPPFRLSTLDGSRSVALADHLPR